MPYAAKIMTLFRKVHPHLALKRAGAVTALTVACCAPVACQDEAAVAPEQRMRVVTLADVDRTALAAPQFSAFRDALVRVRRTEAQRPQPEQDAVVDATTIAAFNGVLETITIEVITIIRDDAWTWDEQQLMNRALRGASIEDLTVNQAPDR